MTSLLRSSDNLSHDDYDIEPEFFASLLATYRANPALTSVMICFPSGGNPEFLVDLFSTLAECPNLSYLSLDEVNFFDSLSMDRLADLLQRSMALSQLHLDYCFIGEVLMTRLARGLRTNTTLTLLSIGGGKTIFNGFELSPKELAPLLEATLQIQHLHLGLAKLNDENGILLANFLSTNSALLTLQIFPCKSTNEALLPLVESLVVNTTLKEFAIPGCQYVGWLDRLSDILQFGINSTLTHLRLFCSGPLNTGIPRFCRAVASNQHSLRSLYLKTDSKVMKVQGLVAMIEDNITLEELRLHDCVNDDGFGEIAAAINRNPVIQSLEMISWRFTQITEKSLTHLIDLIKTNTTLIHLAFNPIYYLNGAQSYALQLGAALAQNATLTSLNLHVDLKWDDAVPYLRQNSSLTTISCYPSQSDDHQLPSICNRNKHNIRCKNATLSQMLWDALEDDITSTIPERKHHRNGNSDGEGLQPNTKVPRTAPRDI